MDIIEFDVVDHAFRHPAQPSQSGKLLDGMRGLEITAMQAANNIEEAVMAARVMFFEGAKMAFAGAALLVLFFYFCYRSDRRQAITTFTAGAEVNPVPYGWSSRRETCVFTRATAY